LTCSHLCCCSPPWLLPTHGCSPLVVPCPLLLLTHSYFPPIVNPYHGCSPIVVPCPSLLPRCYSSLIATPLLLFVAHHCSPILKVPLAPCCYSLLLFPQVFPPPSLLCNIFWSYKQQGKANKQGKFFIIFSFFIWSFFKFFIFSFIFSIFCAYNTNFFFNFVGKGKKTKDYL